MPIRTTAEGSLLMDIYYPSERSARASPVVVVVLRVPGSAEPASGGTGPIDVVGDG